MSRNRRPPARVDAPPPDDRPKRRASPSVLIAAGVVLVAVTAGIVLALALTGGSSEEDKTATEGVAMLPEGAKSSGFSTGSRRTAPSSGARRLR